MQAENPETITEEDWNRLPGSEIMGENPSSQKTIDKAGWTNDMRNSEIPESFRTVIKSAARKLSGPKRREYIAEITNELLDGNARKAERVFGWGRETVKKGLRELDTGIICLDNYSARGNRKTEEKVPELAEDIRSIIRRNGHSGPTYIYTSPKTVRMSLIRTKGYSEDQLPSLETIANILERTVAPVIKTVLFDELPVRCRQKYRKWLKMKEKSGDHGPFVILASKEPIGKNGRRIWDLTFMPQEEYESSKRPLKNSEGRNYYRVIES